MTSNKSGSLKIPSASSVPETAEEAAEAVTAVLAPRKTRAKGADDGPRDYAQKVVSGLMRGWVGEFAFSQNSFRSSSLTPAYDSPAAPCSYPYLFPIRQFPGLGPPESLPFTVAA